MPTQDNIIKPLGSFGLWLFALQHVFFIVIIIYQSLSIAGYKTATVGTFTIGESTYIGGLWTQVVVSGCAWIAWTIFCGVIIIANRLTQLHEAFVSGFPAGIFNESDPTAPRQGNTSFAGVIREDVHSGRAYTVHGDGAVVSRIGGAPATWRSEAEFRAWVDRQPTKAEERSNLEVECNNLR